MTKISTIKDKNNRKAIKFICEQILEVDDDFRNFKTSLKNFYSAKRMCLSDQIPVFSTYLRQTEGMCKRAESLVESIEDETDKFKLKTPEIMSGILTKLQDMDERYNKVDEIFKD